MDEYFFDRCVSLGDKDGLDLTLDILSHTEIGHLPDQIRLLYFAIFDNWYVGKDLSKILSYQPLPTPMPKCGKYAEE